MIDGAVMKYSLFLIAPLMFAQAVTETYANADPQQVMDILRPKEPGLHPAILAIHGGGFRAGSRKGYQATCQTLVQHGYVCATADYRLAPAAPFPAAVYDVKAAVRYLRANASRLGIDPAKIGVMGGLGGCTPGAVSRSDGQCAGV